MKIAKQLVVLTALTAFALAWTAHATESDKEKQQHEVRSMAQDTSQRLYKAEPKTKAAFSHAYGLAVFSNLRVKIVVAGSGNGKGLAVNNKSRRETFMKMLQV